MSNAYDIINKKKGEIQMLGALILTVLNDKELRDGAKRAISKGAKLIGEALQDTDNDGDLDIEDLKAYIELTKVNISVMAHIAKADGDLSEEEEELAYQIIEGLFLDDEDDVAIFPSDLLKEYGVNPRDLLKELNKSFENPFSYKELKKLAKEFENETEVYAFACTIAFADKQINIKERNFLDNLAEEMEITKLEKKRIEKDIFQAD